MANSERLPHRLLEALKRVEPLPLAVALVDAGSMVVLQPVQVNTASQDREGRLVLADGCLVAVLVRLDGEEHGALRGQWLLEAGFGPCGEGPPSPFLSLEDAGQWICLQIGSEQCL